MRWMLTLALGVALPVIASAQNLWWLPGLDFTVRVASTYDKQAPGPLDMVLGYDRDQQVASRLDVRGQCAQTWHRPPVAGHGAIVQAVQVDTHVFAFVHEDGFLVMDARLLPGDIVQPPRCEPVAH